MDELTGESHLTKLSAPCFVVLSFLLCVFSSSYQHNNTTQLQGFFRHFMSDLPSPQIMAGKHECMRDLQPPVSPLQQKLFPVKRTSLPPPAAEVRQKTDNLMCFKDYLGAADQRLTNSVVTLAEGYGTRLAVCKITTAIKFASSHSARGNEGAMEQGMDGKK